MLSHTVLAPRGTASRLDSPAATAALLASVAHEVRNPLFAISALLDAWAARGTDADGERYRHLMAQEVDRLRRLMTGLLEYGQPAAPADLRPLSLAIVLGEAIRACTPLAASRNVRILSDRLPSLVVSTNPDRLVRAFVNVLDNAVQHSSSGSAVTIDWRCEEGEVSPVVCVGVRDRGPGLDDADLLRLFTPFFRGRKNGVGLGLAVAQRVVHEHGGCIRARNDPAGGARFEIILPLDAAREAGRPDLT
jgi:signal transduction histidine kinase